MCITIQNHGLKSELDYLYSLDLTLCHHPLFPILLVFYEMDLTFFPNMSFNGFWHQNQTIIKCLFSFAELALHMMYANVLVKICLHWNGKLVTFTTL